MAVDYIRYDLLAQEALRGVVRTVLQDVAARGLPGEHHFYISFDTRAEGVKIPARVAAQYPKEMTIVLQHQFWDLRVSEDAFEVGLSFNGIPERIVVPLAAIKSFFDPSVQFGLQFATSEAEEGESPGTPASPVRRDTPQVPARRERPPGLPAEPIPAHPASIEAKPDKPDKPGGGGEVVRLDRFRKK